MRFRIRFIVVLWHVYLCQDLIGEFGAPVPVPGSALFFSGERRLRRSSGCIPSRSSGRQLAGVKKKQVPPRFETALAFVWIWLH